jgi:hypothetical protein
MSCNNSQKDISAGLFQLVRDEGFSEEDAVAMTDLERVEALLEENGHSDVKIREIMCGEAVIQFGQGRRKKTRRKAKGKRSRRASRSRK